LWWWSGWHEEWGEAVGCVYYEHGSEIVLIDPLLPPEDARRFLDALDRDVAQRGGDVHVLLTVHWHRRSAAELAERYGARVWAPRRARAALARRGCSVSDPFAPGQTLPAGLTAYPTARGSEVVYWLPAPRALVFGDVVLGDEGGSVRLCPPGWLPRGCSPAELRRSLAPLHALEPRLLLPSHGQPVLDDAAGALARLLAAD